MSYKCPLCDRVSHHPQDELHSYCGHCKLFIKDVALYFDLDKLRAAFLNRESLDPKMRNWFIRRLVESRESK